MKITSIKQQVKNTERVSIYVDGKYSFSLSLDELVTQKLKSGLEIDDLRLAELKKISDEGKIRLKALSWVLLRPHSTKELKDYLRRKKVEADLGEAIISEFLKRKYVDDYSFARHWVEGRRSSRSSSRRKLQLELRQKGVDNEIIKRVLDEGVISDISALNELIAKKGQLPRYRDDQQKFMRYLAGKGFSYDDIKSALEIQKFN